MQAHLSIINRLLMIDDDVEVHGVEVKIMRPRVMI